MITLIIFCINTIWRLFFLFDHLMRNQQFRIDFFERYLYVIDEVFAPERFDEIVDSERDKIKPHYADFVNKLDLPNTETWLSGLDELKDLNEKRSEWIRPKISAWLKEAKAE
ncbi:MAG: CotH kinase family protein [Cyclobacteriaceae bacterium]